jgi:predicted transcriptional regulator
MPRGQKDIAGAVLEEISIKPQSAPTRICSRAGVNYQTMDMLIARELITIEGIGRKRKLTMTNKGKLFLTHWRVCNEILPC